jgi:hypothetical protein
MPVIVTPGDVDASMNVLLTLPESFRDSSAPTFAQRYGRYV